MNGKFNNIVIENGKFTGNVIAGAVIWLENKIDGKTSQLVVSEADEDTVSGRLCTASQATEIVLLSPKALESTYDIIGYLAPSTPTPKEVVEEKFQEIADKAVELADKAVEKVGRENIDKVVEAGKTSVKVVTNVAAQALAKAAKALSDFSAEVDKARAEAEEAGETEEEEIKEEK